jgi:hypothetical protein
MNRHLTRHLTRQRIEQPFLPAFRARLRTCIVVAPRVAPVLRAGGFLVGLCSDWTAVNGTGPVGRMRRGKRTPQKASERRRRGDSIYVIWRAAGGRPHGRI